MGLLSALVSLLSTGTPSRPCFVPSDQTVGWKRVVLPAEAPSLAAPADVEQFRSDEPVSVLDQRASIYLGAYSRHPGRMVYRFAVPRDALQLEVGFLEDLRGAKIDVVAHADGHSVGPSMTPPWT